VSSQWVPLNTGPVLQVFEVVPHPLYGMLHAATGMACPVTTANTATNDAIGPNKSICMRRNKSYLRSQLSQLVFLIISAFLRSSISSPGVPDA
jgi:hypothetical protein